MDIRLPAPISSLLTHVEEAPSRPGVNAVMAWLSKLPVLNPNRRGGLRARWLAKREAAKAVRPRSEPTAPAGPSGSRPLLSLDTLDPPSDWPSEWHSLVQTIPAKPKQRKKRAAVSVVNDRRVPEAEVEGQAFLSLFSANADRMQELQLITQGRGAEGSRQDDWG